MKIVYLHGVGEGDPGMEWLAGLNSGLAELGGAPVDKNEVIAPRYSAILQMAAVESKHPPITYKEKNDHEARRSFELRQARVERKLRDLDDVRSFHLGQVPDGLVGVVQDAAISKAPAVVLRQVKNYLTDEGVRGLVLQRILDDLPQDGEIILIGHSLGSVIAIDLLDHLPEKMHVRRFITIGSPAGSPSLHSNKQRILKRFPYSRVDDWSNFVDPLDGVTAGRGLASLFPGAQDFWVTGAKTHNSRNYLRSRAVATLVEGTLNPGDKVVLTKSDIAPRLTDDEATALLTLEFANAVGHKIPAKQQETRNRYDHALTLVRDLYVADVRARAGGQALPPEIAELVDGKLPAPPRRWNLADTVARVVALAYSNPVAPYEIETGDAQVEAILPVMAALGYPSGTAQKVEEAVTSVNECLRAKRWVPDTKTRVAMAAAGLALLAAGPVGLAMAGAAGTAGAAAITSGLAALGPGGMAGGVAMLSGLAGTGGIVTAAAATARSGSTGVILDPTSIAIQIAIAHALKKVGEEYDRGLWSRIVIAENMVSAQINRLEPLSDPKAPSLERARAARDTITALLTYMKKHGLVPANVVPAVSDPDGSDPDDDSSDSLFPKSVAKMLRR